MIIKCPHCGADNIDENNYCVSCHQPIKDNMPVINITNPNQVQEQKIVKSNDGHVVMIIGINAVIVGLLAGFLLKIDDFFNTDFGIYSWIQINMGLFNLTMLLFYFFFCVFSIYAYDVILKKRGLDIL